MTGAEQEKFLQTYAVARSSFDEELAFYGAQRIVHKTVRPGVVERLFRRGGVHISQEPFHLVLVRFDRDMSPIAAS